MRMWKAMLLIAPLTVVLNLEPGLAHAQRGNGPCREDVQKFCSGVQPGGGRYRDCLQQHAAELSPACQEHLKHVKARVAAWRQACESDVQKLCSGVTPGRGNIVRCLRQHQDEVSQVCKDQLAEHHPRRQAPAGTPGR